MAQPVGQAEAVQVDLHVGPSDISISKLVTSDHRVIEFPRVLLPPHVRPGSVVRVTCEQDPATEEADRKRFEHVQDQILATFAKNIPRKPILSVRSVTQTSVVLEWEPLDVATSDLRFLALYKGNERVGMIPNALKRTSMKVSSLEIDQKYEFSLVLSTSAGDFVSNVLSVHTHKMTDLSGITVCVGSLSGSPIDREELIAIAQRIGARPLQDTIRLDTTHFICSNEDGQQCQRAHDLNIPVVRPEWLEACERERKLVGVRGYYLSADPTEATEPLRRSRAATNASEHSAATDASIKSGIGSSGSPSKAFPAQGSSTPGQRETTPIQPTEAQEVDANRINEKIMDKGTLNGSAELLEEKAPKPVVSPGETSKDMGASYAGSTGNAADETSASGGITRQDQGEELTTESKGAIGSEDSGADVKLTAGPDKDDADEVDAKLSKGQLDLSVSDSMPLNDSVDDQTPSKAEEDAVLSIARSEIPTEDTWPAENSSDKLATLADTNVQSNSQVMPDSSKTEELFAGPSERNADEVDAQLSKGQFNPGVSDPVPLSDSLDGQTSGRAEEAAVLSIERSEVPSEDTWPAENSCEKPTTSADTAIQNSSQLEPVSSKEEELSAGPEKSDANKIDSIISESKSGLSEIPGTIPSEKILSDGDASFNYSDGLAKEAAAVESIKRSELASDETLPTNERRDETDDSVVAKPYSEPLIESAGPPESEADRVDAEMSSGVGESLEASHNHPVEEGADDIAASFNEPDLSGAAISKPAAQSVNISSDVSQDNALDSQPPSSRKKRKNKKKNN